MPTILLADAERDLGDLYQRSLSHHGWKVQTSGDGLECLAQLRRGSPQLLILDTRLPWGGPDGWLAVMRGAPSSHPSSGQPYRHRGLSPEVVPGLASLPVGMKDSRDLDSSRRCS